MAGFPTPTYSLCFYAELWSALDCNISVLVASLPSLRPYFRGSIWRGYISDITGGRFGTTYKSSNGRSGTLSNVGQSERAGPGSGARMARPESASEFSESDLPYIGPHNNAGRTLAARHQMQPSTDEAYLQDAPPLDNVSGKHSTGDGSDIELVLQGTQLRPHTS